MKRILTPARRIFWFKHLSRWHWISAAVCLLSMLLFAVTGITLNHAAQIEAAPRVTERQAQLDAERLKQLAATPSTSQSPLPSEVASWIDDTLSLRVADRAAEWSEDEVYVALPRPGGDAWLSIDRASGEVTYERTDRGWISYLNDLHKGRNTGIAWVVFLDAFAVACLVFCVTGLFLMQLHARQRPATWPVIGLGIAIPLLVALFFIH